MQEEHPVLVVEDDHFYANIYKAKLAKEGIAARIVNNGEEAMKAVSEQVPALKPVLDRGVAGADPPRSHYADERRL